MMRCKRSGTPFRLLVVAALGVGLAVNVDWGVPVAMAMVVFAAIGERLAGTLDRPGPVGTPRRITVAVLAAVVGSATMADASYVWGALNERATAHYGAFTATTLGACATAGLLLGLALFGVKRRWDARHVAWVTGFAAVGAMSTAALAVDSAVRLVVASFVAGAWGISTMALVTYVRWWAPADHRERTVTAFTLAWALGVGVVFEAAVWGSKPSWLDIDGALWLAAALTGLVTPWIRLLPKDRRPPDPRPLREIYATMFRSFRRSRRLQMACLLSAVSGTQLLLLYSTYGAILGGHDQYGFGPWVGAAFLVAIGVMWAIRTMLVGLRAIWIAAVQLAVVFPIAFVWSALGAPFHGWPIVFLAAVIELGSTTLTDKVVETLTDPGADADLENSLQNMFKYGVPAILGLLAATTLRQAGENGVYGIGTVVGLAALGGAVGATHALAPGKLRWPSRDTCRLLAAAAVTSAFAVFAWRAGVAGDSRMLKTEAGHMVADAVVFAGLLLTVWLRARGHRRADRAGALVGALVLLGMALWNGMHAWHSLGHPPQAQATLLMVMGAAALAVHGLRFVLVPEVADSQAGNLARVEIVIDFVGAALTCLAGVLIEAYGWRLADPVATLVTASILSAWALVSVREAVKHPVPALRRASRTVRRRVQAKLPDDMNPVAMWAVEGDDTLVQLDGPAPALAHDSLPPQVFLDDRETNLVGPPRVSRDVERRIRDALAPAGVRWLKLYRVPRRGVLAVALLDRDPERVLPADVLLHHSVVPSE